MENMNVKLGHMNMKNKDIESNKYFKKVVDSVDINCPESYRKTARYFDSYDMNKSFKDGWDNCIFINGIKNLLKIKRKDI